MRSVAWKRFSVAAALILVTFLALGSASQVFAPFGPRWRAFVAADLTLHSPGPAGFPSELFGILQAQGPANSMLGGLYVFNPVSACKLNVPLVVVVSGNLFTNATTRSQTLNFTGFLPPDPCIQSGAGFLRIVVGPTHFVPPDPCELSLHTSNSTITFTGETSRYVVGTTTTTTTTLPP
jgi:hypothetical protein